LGIILNRVSGSTKITGLLQAVKPLKFGSSDNLKAIRLYLGNFHQTVFPLKIKTESWLCEIKEVGDYYNKLKEIEGYAITHVCQLSRTDKNYFFSFIRGFWCNLGQVQGFDVSQKPVWGFWKAPTIKNYTDVSSCITLLSTNPLDLSQPDLGHALEVFLNLWSDETCQRALKTAIQFYLEANLQTNVDTSLVIAQTGLETVSYIKNVIKGSIIKETFVEKKAPGSIRLLLDEAKIPYDMSDSPYHWLAIYGHQNGAKKGETTIPIDGVEIITRMRNGIVHVDKHDRVFSAVPEERICIKELALHYLELSLLFLFGYKGKYRNRMTKLEEETPWSNHKVKPS
jgi:hypothetical protein